MTLYTIQIIAKSNDIRSLPISGNPSDLINDLNKLLNPAPDSVPEGSRVPTKQDFIIVLLESDPDSDDPESMRISRKPLVTLETFLKVITSEATTETEKSHG